MRKTGGRGEGRRERKERRKGREDQGRKKSGEMQAKVMAIRWCVPARTNGVLSYMYDQYQLEPGSLLSVIVHALRIAAV